MDSTGQVAVPVGIGRTRQLAVLRTDGSRPLTFTADASARPFGARVARQAPQRGVGALQCGSLPTEDDELWKYSDVGRLDLDSFAPFAFDTSRGRGATAS